MPTREEVIAYLQKLSSVELEHFIQELQQALGVEPPPPPPPPTVTMGAPLTTESEITEYRVWLMHPGPDRVRVIQALRRLAPFSMIESKAFVDGAPALLREGLTREQAEQWVRALREAGAEVERRDR